MQEQPCGYVEKEQCARGWTSPCKGPEVGTDLEQLKKSKGAVIVGRVSEERVSGRCGQTGNGGGKVDGPLQLLTFSD